MGRDRVRIETRDGHLAVVEDGRLSAAFPLSDRAGAEKYARISRRIFAEAAPEAAKVAEPEPGPDAADLAADQPGGDGAATWPSWAEDWVWSPHEDSDEQTLANQLDESWADAGPWVDETRFSVTH